MSTFGGLVFEHGSRIGAVIVDTATLKICDAYSLDFTYDPTKDEQDYCADFQEFAQWLAKRTDEFSYFGPKLSGTHTRRKGSFQPVREEPAEDSKAFMSIVSPLSKKKLLHYRIKQRMPPGQRAAVELAFDIESSDSHLIYAVMLALRQSYGVKQKKFQEIVDLIRASPLYKAKLGLITAMLPTSQARRAGFAALKKAAVAWNAPNKRQSAAIAEITDATLRAQYERVVKSVQEASIRSARS